MSDRKNDISLARVQAYNWLLLAIMTSVGWLAVSSFFALGVLIGGLIAGLSFGLLKNDLIKVMAGPLNVAKTRFFIKYYARLTVLALILFLIINYKLVHITGLLVGLSTVLVSIGVTVAGLAKRTYFTAKEA